MIGAFCILLTLLPSPFAIQGTADDAKAILAKALEASGGLDALKRARVLNWRGRATIYAAGRQIRIEGRWVIEPPDRARVTTWEVDKGEASARRLIVDGDSGLMERDGKSTPMPAEMLANEREQFYLYSVLKLTGLLEPDVKLAAIREKESDGLDIVRSGRPAVKIFFDEAGRPTNMRVMVSDPRTREPVQEDLQFEGVIESEGVRWPRRIRILQAGALFFDLEITEFSVTR